MRTLSRLFWRLLPICLVVYAMRGSAVQYTKYFVMVKEASGYAITYMNLSQYVTSLAQYYAQHGTLPEDLSSFLRSSFAIKGHDPSLDQWDSRYRVTETKNQFTLISCGPDRTCFNEDDVSASGPKVGMAPDGTL